MKDSYLKLRITEKEYIKFQEVCDSKNKTMSEVLRYFIETYSSGKNIILLDVDNDTLRDASEICKEKKIKFNDLISFLLSKAIKNKDKLNLK